MSARRRTRDPIEDGAYRIVAAALPYGPPLTPAERILRGGLFFTFFALLLAESLLLWRLWSLWG